MLAGNDLFWKKLSEAEVADGGANNCDLVEKHRDVVVGIIFVTMFLGNIRPTWDLKTTLLGNIGDAVSLMK